MNKGKIAKDMAKSHKPATAKPAKTPLPDARRADSAPSSRATQARNKRLGEAKL